MGIFHRNPKPQIPKGGNGVPIKPQMNENLKNKRERKGTIRTSTEKKSMCQYDRKFFD